VLRAILSALSAFAVAFLALPVQAEEPSIQLKLSHWVPPSHPLQASIQEWADSIKKDSQGSITSVIFPAEQLGKALDYYDMARDGIADFAYVNPGYQPGRFPIIARSDLPFTYKDAQSGSAAVDAWYRAYAQREMKDVHFCLAFVHAPATLHSRKRIMMPADLHGLKFRPSNATIGSFVRLLGGTNVQASAPAARDLLERGVADGIFFPWGSLVLFGIDHAVHYHIDTEMYVSTFVWVMNKDRYSALLPAQKHVIDAHCTTEWAVRFATPWAEFEEAGRGKIKAEPGHELIALTPAQLDAWKQAAIPLHTSWATEVRRIGADPIAIEKAFQASLQKYHAAY